MIIEVAHIKVKPGHEAEFEAAVQTASAVFRKAKGCKGLHLQRCIEAPAEYEAVIRWETLEDHTVGFRQSELFQQWRELVGPHFDGPPQVRHHEIAIPRIDF
ncbi:MAG: antibiotic biosynthesis monooxygenase [Hoeflea sp.]|uniref:antibiotic biosynthesis monooxygenase family protein n=1 Tax=Hoeflea sp. TaxID=1940281 RepID=UPI000C0D33B5|nr:antibiotic biosynthesis monooxygenase [Hoeflea sp.]PHR25438.1 MAG: antibiotic biosynthesis monooxygenase [Hoeflea sp.]